MRPSTRGTHDWDTKLLEASHKSCRHACLKIRNRPRHPAACPAECGELAGTSHKSCCHSFYKIQNRLGHPEKSAGDPPGQTRNRVGHPAKVVVTVFSKHKIPLGVHQTVPGDEPNTWDIPPKCCRQTKSLGTSYTWKHGFWYRLRLPYIQDIKKAKSLIHSQVTPIPRPLL